MYVKYNVLWKTAKLYALLRANSTPDKTLLEDAERSITLTCVHICNTMTTV